MRERNESPAVAIEGATVVEGDTELLSDINLRIEEGERVCILGPNGSGKSTLVRLMAGELRARHREPAPVRLFGEELWNLFSLRARIGFVSDRLQGRHAGGETVRDVLLSAFFGSVGLPLRVEIGPTGPELRITIDPVHLSEARELAAFLGIERLLERRTDSLSSGEMRRVLIGRALVHKPRMLLLDEPYTSLDIASRYSLARLVRTLLAQGLSLILVTHELADIPPEVERVILLKEGRVVADGPAAAILDSAVLSGLFGVALRVERGAEGWRALVSQD